MVDVQQLTAGQARVLAALAKEPNDDRHSGLAAAAVARRAWPDSPGWTKRSRRHSTPAGGAVGVGLPMLAGRMLGQLATRGLVGWHHHMGSYTAWWITPEGRTALATYQASR